MKKLQIKRALNQKETAVFFHQLAILLSAGIPLLNCFDILKNDEKTPHIKHLISTIQIQIETGQTLSQCLRVHSQSFEHFTCQLIEFGEYTGTVDDILMQIAKYYEKSLALKSKIKNALFYPCITLCIAFLICIVLLVIVIPRFAELFQTIHCPLPLLTRILLSISHEMSHAQFWFYLFLGISMMAIQIYSLPNHRVSNLRDFLLLQVPFLSAFIKKDIMSKFAYYLFIAFNAGIPIPEALTLIAKSLKNTLYSHAVSQLTVHIMNGQQLYQSMHNVNVFSTFMINMVKIGEESGQLAVLLEKISMIYEEECHRILTQFTVLLEPLILIILGFLIGGIIVAMYLPIFQLGTVM